MLIIIILIALIVWFIIAFWQSILFALLGLVIIGLILSFFTGIVTLFQKTESKEVLIYGECPFGLPQEAVLYLVERKGYKVLKDGKECRNPESAFVVAGKFPPPDKSNSTPEHSTVTEYGIELGSDYAAKKLLPLLPLRPTWMGGIVPQIMVSYVISRVVKKTRKVFRSFKMKQEAATILNVSEMADKGAKEISFKNFYKEELNINNKAEARKVVNYFNRLRSVQIKDLSGYKRIKLPVQVVFADSPSLNKAREKAKEQQICVVDGIDRSNARNTFAVIHDDMFDDVASCNLTAQVARFYKDGARVMSYDDFFKIP